MVKTKILSPSKSFKEWKFSEWFVGNWKTIKEIAKVGAPLLVSSLIVSHPALIAFLTILGKFLLDTGEFFFKEITN